MILFPGIMGPKVVGPVSRPGTGSVGPGSIKQGFVSLADDLIPRLESGPTNLRGYPLATAIATASVEYPTFNLQFPRTSVHRPNCIHDAIPLNCQYQTQHTYTVRLNKKGTYH